MVCNKTDETGSDIRFDSFLLNLVPFRFRNYVVLMRLDRPIGYWLLFWPCAISSILALSLAPDLAVDFSLWDLAFYNLLYLIGAIVMRGAGCVINDIIDKDLDRRVSRTKQRPIASGAVSISQGLTFLFFLSFTGFIILLQFNILTIYLGLMSLPLIVLYPLMKRFTWYPQAVLGLVFNWGAIIGYVSVSNQIDLAMIILHIGLFFWTIGYDTIYACQDIEDDSRFGVYSTALRYKSSVKKFVFICYAMCILLLFSILYFTNLGGILSYLFFLILIGNFSRQLYLFDESDSVSCLRIFRSNHLSGFLLTILFSIEYILLSFGF